MHSLWLYNYVFSSWIRAYGFLFIAFEIQGTNEKKKMEL